MMDENDKKKADMEDLRADRPAALERLNAAWMQADDPDCLRDVMDEEADAQGAARYEGAAPLLLRRRALSKASRCWSTAACCPVRADASCSQTRPCLHSRGSLTVERVADQYNVMSRCKYKYNPFFEMQRYLPAIGTRALLAYRGTAVEVLGDPSDVYMKDQWQRRMRKQAANSTCGTRSVRRRNSVSNPGAVTVEEGAVTVEEGVGP